MIRRHGNRNRANIMRNKGGRDFYGNKNDMTEYQIHGLDMLAKAIIERAVVDYRVASCGRRPSNFFGNPEYLKEEVERFFQSDWCRELTDSAEDIYETIKEEKKMMHFEVSEVTEDKNGFHATLYCYMNDELYQIYNCNGRTIETLEDSVDKCKSRFIAYPWIKKLSA